MTQPHSIIPARYPKADLVGQRFGRLVVVSFQGRGKASLPFWQCQCDCGTEKRIAGTALRAGLTKSCGCLSRERKRTDPRGFQAIHGMTHTRTFQRWQGMLARCYKPYDASYYNYGGRGIMVCERWRNSFQHFYDDMGAVPEGMQLDRIDNMGHYEPGNCRWATPIEQGNNRRTNRKILYQGEEKTLAEWTRFQGLPENVLGKRLEAGWSLERAMTTPLRRDSRHERMV